jgi:hypothetical protein
MHGPNPWVFIGFLKTHKNTYKLHYYYYYYNYYYYYYYYLLSKSLFKNTVVAHVKSLCVWGNCDIVKIPMFLYGSRKLIR